MALGVVLVSGGFDHKIRYWEATTGLCSRTVRFNESQVNCIQISRDKSMVAAGGSSHLQLYDVNSLSDSALLSFDGHTNNVTELGIQRDGKWLYSCSEDGTMRVWDVRTPSCQFCNDFKSPLNTIALHPSQVEVILGDQNGVVRIWDLTAGALRTEFTPQPQMPVRSVSIASDASFLSVGLHKGFVNIYKPDDNKQWKKECDFRAHRDYLLRNVISPDARNLATTSADHSVKIWNTETWELTKTLAQHQKWVWDAVFSADSSYMVTASSDQTAKLWDLRSGEVVRNYAGHTLAVTCVALNDSQ